MLSLTGLFKEYNPRQYPTGEIRMACPFRENHTGSADGRHSFYINAEHTSYKCWSCKVYGSLRTLLVKKFDVPYTDAIEIANIADLINKRSFVRYEDLDLMEENLPEYFPEQLIEFTKQPIEMLTRKVPISKETLRGFRVGVRYNDSGEEITTIPLYQNGVLVGIKCRIGRTFWYEPKEFGKGNFLYNEHSLEDTIVVEGETDVYHSYDAGITNVVAILGSELTEGQAERLKKYKRIFVAQDNDKAGTISTEIIYQYMKSHSEVLIVPYPSNDPGDCPPGAWRKSLSEATDYYTYSQAMANSMGEYYIRIKNAVAKNFSVNGKK